ncbi:MAG: hypothetical protein IPK94_02800 [Saprospiraceae bacterium]|nr:hypothetical protein [Saprospiraceae bacterium]
MASITKTFADGHAFKVSLWQTSGEVLGGERLIQRDITQRRLGMMFEREFFKRLAKRFIKLCIAESILRWSQ